MFGADEDKQKQLMLDLINDFGIQDKVTIHDFTSNPLDEFRKSKRHYSQVHMRDLDLPLWRY